MHVVVVTFDIKPEFMVKFREEVLSNAALTLANEPECRIFDVCESGTEPRIFLYELYDDAAAFDKHLETEHFLRFNAVTADWVANKMVQRYERVSPRTPQEL